MGLLDIVIVISIFIAFAYMILAKMYRRNPEKTGKLIEYLSGMREKAKQQQEDLAERRQQIYTEKRELL